MISEKSQRVKLIVGVGLLLLSAIFYFFYGRSTTGLSDSINFVDISSGQSFKIEREKMYEIPMLNEKTGEKTLFPCVIKDRRMYIDPHYRSAINTIKGVNLVNLSTLEVDFTKK